MTNSNENNMDMRIITVLGFITNHKTVTARKVLTTPTAKAIWPTKNEDGEATTFVRLRYVYGEYNATTALKDIKDMVSSYVCEEHIEELGEAIKLKSDGFLSQAQKATDKHRSYNRFFTVAENLPKVGDVISVHKSKLMSKQAREHFLAKAEENAKAQAIVDAIMG